MINIGSLDIDNISIGNNNVEQIYVGNDLVWEKEGQETVIKTSNSSNTSVTLNINKSDSTETMIYLNNALEAISTTSGSQDIGLTLPAGNNKIKILSEGTWYIDDYCLGSSSNNATIINVSLGANYGGTIGENAFRGSNISQIVIPSSVYDILARAFQECTQLEEISFKHLTGSINFGSYVFQDCTSLDNVYLPNDVSLGSYIFKNCTSLTTIYLRRITGSSTPFIPDGAFQNCTSLANVGYLRYTRSIGNYSFENCTSLTSVDISGDALSSATSIGMATFKGCTSLNSITLSDNLRTVLQSAFENCTSLTTINLKNKVSNIGGSAFKGCTKLSSVYVQATTPPKLGSYAFDDTRNCPIYVPTSKVNTYKAASGWSTYASRIRAIY